MSARQRGVTVPPTLLALVIGFIWVGNVVALEYATAGFYDHVC